MAQEVTLGGERLGSGNKQKVPMHNYGMNSFNLEQDFKSSMAPGILYPFIKLIGTNHGTFDIDLDSMVRTLPTKGPLFGSFKLQVDLFNVPFRLYQGILHNNPTELGLNMDKVFLPKVWLRAADGLDRKYVAGSTDDNWQVNESSLLKYCGISGWGQSEQQTSHVVAKRKIQCVPMLAYYDIFKCYYSNKQEEKAYVITPQDEPVMEVCEVGYIQLGKWDDNKLFTTIKIEYDPYWEQGDEFGSYDCYIYEDKSYLCTLNIYTKNKKLDLINILDGNNSYETVGTLQDFLDNGYAQIINQGIVSLVPGNPLSVYNGYYFYQINILNNASTKFNIIPDSDLNYIELVLSPVENKFYVSDIVLRPFALKNIDKMRYKLLATNELNSEFQIDANVTDDEKVWGYESGEDTTGMPYIALSMQTQEGMSWNAFQDNGLVVKTYQSDLFNNWLESSFVDAITAASSVDTSNGSFTMDALNLAEKVYELLNRILVGGGTYQDWQDACYGEGTIRMCETPMYVGGYAAEIMFEEVISSAETSVNGDYQPLGSLGGRGRQSIERGGRNIHIKMDEPGYVIGIVSITPRICYSQGNDWDMTELDTINDLHKPALDGIGFQNLMIEQFAWWNTILNASQGGIKQRNSAGKQTAWINYQTAVDKCFGDFAKTDGFAFMVLNRNYEHGDAYNKVKDVTTYIDPAKYNYAFAYTDLAAQNFWVQIHSRVIARRKMGAQQLPNL